MCSFETINSKTGVPEKRIPAANAFLVSTGLLMNIGKEHAEEGVIRRSRISTSFVEIASFSLAADYASLA